MGVSHKITEFVA